MGSWEGEKEDFLVSANFHAVNISLAYFKLPNMIINGSAQKSALASQCELNIEQIVP